MPLMRGRGRAGAGGAGSWSSRTPTKPRSRPPRCGNRRHPRPLPSLALAISTWSRTRFMWGLPLFPAQASTLAPQVDALFFFMLGVSAFFSLLIAGLIVYFAIKYHRRSEDEETDLVHEPMALELTWTMVPLALAMVMYAWGASVFF